MTVIWSKWCKPLRPREGFSVNFSSLSIKHPIPAIMLFALLSLAGLTGCPQISLPLVQHQGVPLGISLLGPANADALLVGLAEQVAKVALVS